MALAVLAGGAAEAAAQAAGSPGRFEAPGVLDLRGVPLGDRVLTLSGTWRAYAVRPGGETDVRRAARFDYDAADWHVASVPAYFAEQGFPTRSLVWYRLRLRLPPDAPRLHGYVQHVNSAHALYVAQPGGAPKLLAASGAPRWPLTATEHSRRPVTFTLPRDTALVLTWAVANRDYVVGGPFYAIELGTGPAMDRLVTWRAVRAFVSAAVYAFVLLVFLLLWSWQGREARVLAVALLALIVGVRAAVISGMPEYLQPGVYGFEGRIRLEALTFLGGIGAMGFLLWSFFPREFAAVRLGPLRLAPPLGAADLDAAFRLGGRPPLPWGLRALNTGVAMTAMGASVVAVAVALVAGPSLTSHAMALARGLCLLLLLPGLAIVAMAVERRRAMARLVAAGFVLMLAGAAHDILLAMGHLDGQPYLGTYAFLGFVLVQGYAVVRQSVHYARFAQAAVVRLEDDIVERTRYLSDAIAETQAAHQRQTRFLRTVAHEVRTPLTSIIGYADVLREELQDTLGDDQHHFLAAIRESAQRITGLVNDLLDLEKVAAGHLDLHPGAVTPHDVVEPVVDELRPLAARKGLALTVAVADDAPAVWADAVRLRQVLLNLGANAVKFTDAGTVTLRAAPDGPDAVRFTVEDTGPGIPADTLPHIFDQFTRAQDTFTCAHGTGHLDAGLGAHGSGLGLSIAKELVLRMDGAIDVETARGEGSTFIVLLPAADAVHPDDDAPLPEVSVSAPR